MPRPVSRCGSVTPSASVAGTASLAAHRWGHLLPAVGAPTPAPLAVAAGRARHPREDRGRAPRGSGGAAATPPPRAPGWGGRGIRPPQRLRPGRAIPQEGYPLSHPRGAPLGAVVIVRLIVPAARTAGERGGCHLQHSAGSPTLLMTPDVPGAPGNDEGRRSTRCVALSNRWSAAALSAWDADHGAGRRAVRSIIESAGEPFCGGDLQHTLAEPRVRGRRGRGTRALGLRVRRGPVGPGRVWWRRRRCRRRPVDLPGHRTVGRSGQARSRATG